MDDEDENLVDWGYDDDEEVQQSPSSHDHTASDQADGFNALIREDTTLQPSGGPSLLSRISGNIQPVSPPASKKKARNETQNASNSIHDPSSSDQSTTQQKAIDPASRDPVKESVSQSSPSTSRSASSVRSSTAGRRSLSGREELPPSSSQDLQPATNSVLSKGSRPADSYAPGTSSSQRQPPPPPLPRSQPSEQRPTELKTSRPSTAPEEPLSLKGLSSEWEVRTSRTSQGAKYYFNKRTKQSSWEPPEGTTGTGPNAEANDRGKSGSNTPGLPGPDRVGAKPDRRPSGDWKKDGDSSRLTDHGWRGEDERRRNRAEGWDLERDRQAGREGRLDSSIDERRSRQTAIETPHRGPSGYSSKPSSNPFQEAHDRSTPGSRNGQSLSNPRRSPPAPAATASEQRRPSERMSQQSGYKPMDHYRDKSRDKPPSPSSTTTTTITTDTRPNTLPTRDEPTASRGREARPETVVPSGPRNTVSDGPVGGEPYGRRRAPPVAGVNAVSAQGSAMRKWGTATVSVDEKQRTAEATDVSVRENDDKRRAKDEEERDREKARERDRQKQREDDERKRREEDEKDREKDRLKSREKPKEVVPAASSAYDPTAPFELSEEEKALILAKRQRAAQEEHARVVKERVDRPPDDVQKAAQEATRDAYSRRRQPAETTNVAPVYPTRDGPAGVIDSVVDSTGGRKEGGGGGRPDVWSSSDVVDLTRSSSPPAFGVVESTVPMKRGYDDFTQPESSTPSEGQARNRNRNRDTDPDGIRDADKMGGTGLNRVRYQDTGSDDVGPGLPRPIVPGWGPGARRGQRGHMSDRLPPYGGPPRDGGRGGFSRGGRGGAWSGTRPR